MSEETTMRLSRLFFILLCAAGCGSLPGSDDRLPGDGKADGAEGGSLYNFDKVLSLSLILSDDAKAALTRNPTGYVEGTLTVGGVRHGVRVRLDGPDDGTRLVRGKPTWRIQFTDGQLFFGRSVIYLDNLAHDPTLVRQALAYKLYRALKVPAPCPGDVQVSLNDQPLGL
jgi:hypothetical protein